MLVCGTEMVSQMDCAYPNKNLRETLYFFPFCNVKKIDFLFMYIFCNLKKIDFLFIFLKVYKLENT